MANEAKDSNDSMPNLGRSDPSRVIDVAAGLVFRGGRLLVTQRRPGDHLGGLWEFPGGKVEPGESFPECLRRELREELNLEIETEELLQAITHTYPEKTVHLQFYRCTCGAGTPQPLGCHALAWVSCDELLGYAFPAADTQLLELLRNRPDLWQDRGRSAPAF
jgi:8-oxo-dGTP diphosphatase